MEADGRLMKFRHICVSGRRKHRGKDENGSAVKFCCNEQQAPSEERQMHV